MCCFFKRMGGGLGNADGNAWEMSELGLARPAERRTAEQTPAKPLCCFIFSASKRWREFQRRDLEDTTGGCPKYTRLICMKTAIKYSIPCIWWCTPDPPSAKMCSYGIFSVRLVALFWTVHVLLPQNHSIYFTVDLSKWIQHVCVYSLHWLTFLRAECVWRCLVCGEETELHSASRSSQTCCSNNAGKYLDKCVHFAFHVHKAVAAAFLILWLYSS